MKFLIIALTLTLAAANPVKEILSHDAVSLTVNGVADDQLVDLTSIVGIELNSVNNGAVENIDIMSQYYEVQAEAAAGEIVAAPAIAPAEEEIIQPAEPVEEISILPIDIDESVVQPIAPVEENPLIPIAVEEPIVAPVEEIAIVPVDVDDSAVQAIVPINGEVFNDGQVSFSVYGATQDALNKVSSWMSIMYNYVAGGVSATSDLI